MASDTARTEYVPPIERRKRAVELCKEVPCNYVRWLLEGDSRFYPKCVLCVHEGAVRKQLEKHSLLKKGLDKHCTY